MITDGDLYQIAIFLGSASMILIVLYHYLEVNATDSTGLSPLKARQAKAKA